MNHSTLEPRPKARAHELITQEMRDEVLVYDLASQDAHCLNQTAASVWKHCDGETTVSELSELVSSELGTSVDDAMVWHALGQLQKRGLLAERVERPEGVRRVSRRDLMKWTLAGAAVPLVTSIAAPAAAAAVSCQVDSNGCKPNGNNEAGQCTSDLQCCSCCCHPDQGEPSNAHCAAFGSGCGGPVQL